MRPYKNLSPFQYSKGLDLILVLRLSPVSHDVPEAMQTTYIKLSTQQLWDLKKKKTESPMMESLTQ